MNAAGWHARALGGLRRVAVASLVLCVPTAGFAVHYTRGYAEARAGRSLDEQRASLLGVPYFKRPFLDTIERLRRTLPEDARLLVEPAPHRTPDGRTLDPYSGQARWFLYLNHFAYPLRVYVRRPRWAAGTLVDYPRWIDHHLAALYRPDPTLRLDGDIAIEQLGIEWRLRYPVAPPRKSGSPPPFHARQLVLERRTPGGWEKVDLFPPDAPPPVDDPRDDVDDAGFGPGGGL